MRRSNVLCMMHVVYPMATSQNMWMNTHIHICTYMIPEISFRKRKRKQSSVLLEHGNGGAAGNRGNYLQY